MKNYLIRFDESSIIAVTPLSPGAEVSGKQNEHIVTNLTTAMVLFFNAGYDITRLFDEFNKQEEEY